MNFILVAETISGQILSVYLQLIVFSMSKLPPLAAALFGNRIVKKTSDSQHEVLLPTVPGNITTLTATPAVVGDSAAPRNTVATTSPTKRSRIELQTVQVRTRIPHLATRLFGANRANFCLPVGSSPTKTKTQTENCNYACYQGCRPDSDAVLVEEDESDDEFDVVDRTTGHSDEDTTDDSSVEDAEDAFENFESQDSNLTSGTTSKIKKETLRKEVPPSINEKKTTRQKGDAESLKKYAYG